MKYSRRLRRPIRGGCCLALAGLTFNAAAQLPDASNPLDQFAADVDSLDSRFLQETLDADGLAIEFETFTGRFRMQRPDKFHWHQDPPEEQIVVADGKLVWHYDVDLEQVTCFPLEEFAANPALLLSGDGKLSDNYDVVELPADNERQQIELKPLDERNSDFVSALVQLEDGVPVQLDLLDGLQQVTRVSFTDRELNSELPAETFRLEPTDDVHVVCDLD